MFQMINIDHLFESSISKAVIRILEMDLKLVIIDCDENEINCPECFRMIKKIRPRLPIMAISSEYSDEIHDQYKSSGADYLLVKPLNFEKMIDYIVLNGH